MRALLILLLISKVSACFCQAFLLSGRVVDSRTHEGFPGASVLFAQENIIVMGGSTDGAGMFRVERMTPGTYDVSVKVIGYRTETLGSLVVSDTTRNLIIPFPGPCKYFYIKGVKPVCGKGHTDGIIPIIYGLPGRALMEKAKREEIHLGGCMVSDCDPKYYCTIHEVEL